jgi:predicted transcriptional regulator
MPKRRASGELEAKVMDILWGEAAWLIPADVQARLPRRPPLAYTTVMTILTRLWEKGMLDRERDGRAYAYRPVQTREEWAAQRMLEILDTSGDRGAALHHFADEIGKRDASQLRLLLEEKRRK